MSEPQHYLLGGHEPIELTEYGRLSIGRNPRNKLVVPDGHVSRNHAEIYFDGTQYLLADLNSSKGTRVNGASVSTHVLQDGDVINIGQYSYTYRIVEGESGLREALQEFRKLASLQSTLDGLPEDVPAPTQKDFSGQLEALPLNAICRILMDDQRSGILVLNPSAGDKIKLFFQKGQVRRAESGRSEGDAALTEAFAAQAGSFEFQASTVPITPNVEADLNTFLGAANTEIPTPPPPASPSPPPASRDHKTDFPF